MNIFRKFFVFIFLLILFFPSFSFGQNTATIDPAPSGGSSVSLKNPITSGDVPTLIEKVLEGIIKIGIPLIALALVYSGFLYVLAIGNPGKIKTAHSALINTLIGAVLLLGAWGLSQVIVETVQGL